MEKEAKAKVVVSVWGAEFFQFLAALAVLSRSIWKNRMYSTLSSKLTKAKLASAARNWIKSAPPNRRDDLCLRFSLHSSSSMERRLKRVRDKCVQKQILMWFSPGAQGSSRYQHITTTCRHSLYEYLYKRTRDTYSDAGIILRTNKSSPSAFLFLALATLLLSRLGTFLFASFTIFPVALLCALFALLCACFALLCALFALLCAFVVLLCTLVATLCALFACGRFFPLCWFGCFFAILFFASSRIFAARFFIFARLASLFGPLAGRLVSSSNNRRFTNWISWFTSWISWFSSCCYWAWLPFGSLYCWEVWKIIKLSLKVTKICRDILIIVEHYCKWGSCLVPVRYWTLCGQGDNYSTVQ